MSTDSKGNEVIGLAQQPLEACCACGPGGFEKHRKESFGALSSTIDPASTWIPGTLGGGWAPAPAITSTVGYSQPARSPIKAMNGVVLCEPFKTNVVKKRERSGFATIDQKVTLTGLKVLIGTDEVPTGSTVYVRAEACQAGWGKETFEAEGQPPFIRVPVTEIVYMVSWDYSYGNWKLAQVYNADGNKDAPVVFNSTSICSHSNCPCQAKY